MPDRRPRETMQIKEKDNFVQTKVNVLRVGTIKKENLREFVHWPLLNIFTKRWA